jgi:AraC family transcriptional regulator, transcriptional activator of pobA
MAAEIKRISFKPGLPQEIEIIPIAATFSKHKESTIQPHRAEFYHIFWFQQGTATHLIDFKPVQVKPNTILFVNKHRVHLFDQKVGYDGKLLLFTDSFFGKSEADLQFLRSTILFNDLLDEPVLQLQESSPVITAFNTIEAELAQPNDTYHFNLLHNSLHNLLLLAERERRKTGFTEIKRGADLDYTLLFKNLLDEQYKQVKTVSAYAGQMAVSEKRLTQATSTTVGKTPKELIDERVLLEIKRLLVHTSLSIKEIGYDLGFEEPTNFIKYFRKHEKMTPIEFREHYTS